jgi:hypothetical protein
MLEQKEERAKRSTAAQQNRREALAKKVAAGFANFASFKDDVARLWKEFERLPKGETIMGCDTKTEFCEKVLGRSIRAVRYMLDGGNFKRGASATQETVSPVDTEPIPEPTPEAMDDVLAEYEPEAKPAEPIASGGFWEDLYKRLNALVPTYSDGTHHKTVEMLQRAYTETTHTQTEKDFRNYVIKLLVTISKDFAEYAQRLKNNNAELVQGECPTTSGEMAYQPDHSAPIYEAAL